MKHKNIFKSWGNVHEHSKDMLKLEGVALRNARRDNLNVTLKCLDVFAAAVCWM